MTTKKIFKPFTALACATSAFLTCSYSAYRFHDRRDLSEDEIEDAHHNLAEISPQRFESTSQQYQHDGGTSQHLSNLNKFGASVVKQSLSPALVANWNTISNETFANVDNNIVWISGRAHYSISKRSDLFSEMAKIGRNNNIEENQVSGAASFRRRFDLFWSRKPIGNKSSTESTSLGDIVKAYFEQNNIQRFELTDVQFLNAYIDSTNQIWHRDNTCCGLTAIVALKDVRTNGPTELLIGMHRRDFSLWNVFCLAFFDTNDTSKASLVRVGLPLLGCLNSGDAILYDARIFHRGRGYRRCNRDSDQDRPVLVLRWDAANSPPPGAGIIKTTANTYIGCFLYASLSAIQQFTKRKEGVNESQKGC